MLFPLPCRSISISCDPILSWNYFLYDLQCFKTILFCVYIFNVFLPRVFINSFWIPGFMLKSLLHFELFFFFSCRRKLCAWFHSFLCVYTQCSQHHLLERLSSSESFDSIVKAVAMEGYFRILYSIPLIYMSGFLSVPCRLCHWAL